MMIGSRGLGMSIFHTSIVGKYFSFVVSSFGSCSELGLELQCTHLAAASQKGRID